MVVLEPSTRISNWTDQPTRIHVDSSMYGTYSHLNKNKPKNVLLYTKMLPSHFFFSLIPNFAKVFESRPCAMFKTARNIPETSGLDVHFKNLYFYQLRRKMFMGAYISKGNGHILKNYLAVKKTVRPLSGWRKTHMEILFCSSKLLSHIIYVCVVVFCTFKDLKEFQFSCHFFFQYKSINSK